MKGKLFFADRTFRRILKNFSWLLVGQIFMAIANFGYLSLTAHSLGVASFGKLIIIKAYIELIIGVTTFQSWQALIRYGATFIKDKNTPAFQELLKITTLLDVLGSCTGFLVAIAVAPFIGKFLDWSPETIAEVQRFSILILFTLWSTPIGLLRLYDRFNIIAFQQTVLPITRFIGTIIAFVNDAPLSGYLLAWVCAEAANGLFYLILGWREAGRQGLLENMDWSFPNLFQADRKLLKFCIVSNLNSSLPLTLVISPLIIGLFANPVTVGLFRAGYELATPLRDLALLLTQSVYPELAHLSSQERWRKFKNVLIRLGITLKGIGFLLLVLCILFGKPLLGFAMGDEFLPAYLTLLILVIAGIFKMGNCLLEPALFAMELPHISLRVNSISILIVYLPLLIILTLKYGAFGAGLATLISDALSFSLNSFFTVRSLQEKMLIQKQFS